MSSGYADEPLAPWETAAQRAFMFADGTMAPARTLARERRARERTDRPTGSRSARNGGILPARSTSNWSRLSTPGSSRQRGGNRQQQEQQQQQQPPPPRRTFQPQMQQISPQKRAQMEQQWALLMASSGALQPQQFEHIQQIQQQLGDGGGLEKSVAQGAFRERDSIEHDSAFDDPELAGDFADEYDPRTIERQQKIELLRHELTEGRKALHLYVAEHGGSQEFDAFHLEVQRLEIKLAQLEAQTDSPLPRTASEPEPEPEPPEPPEEPAEAPAPAEAEAEAEPELEPLELPEAELQEAEAEPPLMPPGTVLSQKFDPSAFFDSDGESSDEDSDGGASSSNGSEPNGMPEARRKVEVFESEGPSPDEKEQYFQLFRANEELRGVSVELSRLNQTLEDELQTMQLRLQENSELRLKVSDVIFLAPSPLSDGSTPAKVECRGGQQVDHLAHGY